MKRRLEPSGPQPSTRIQGASGARQRVQEPGPQPLDSVVEAEPSPRTASQTAPLRSPWLGTAQMVDLSGQLPSRLAAYSACNIGVQQRTAARNQVRLRRLMPDHKGIIATTDIAPGGLREAAERLELLYRYGFCKLWLTLVDAGYQNAQLGRYDFVAAAAHQHTPCRHDCAAAQGAAEVRLAPSDVGGRHLALFIRQLERWLWTKPLLCTLYVSRSTEQIARLTRVQQVPQSHVVTGYGGNSGSYAQQIARVAHPRGHFTIHDERTSEDTLNMRAPCLCAGRPGL